MITVLGILFIAFVGLIYTILSRNKLIYITAPEAIFSLDEKWKILYGHLIASFIMGIGFINILIKNTQPEIYNWINKNELLPYSFIAGIIISFMIVSGIIQAYLIRSNAYFANTKYIIENPDLIVPDDYYVTNESLDDLEFWEMISMLNDIHRFQNELDQRHPVWIMKLYHKLIDEKITLIKSGILPVYNYIFKKYQDDLHDCFCEYIIGLGKNRFDEIRTNLDKISECDFHPAAIPNYSITPLLNQSFFLKTGKPIVFTKEFEDLSTYYQKEISIINIEITFPTVFKKFK